MRCTSKVLAVFLAMSVGSTLLTGCTQEVLVLPYTLDSSISSFSITENKMAQTANSFAQNLCVTSTNVIADDQPDMSEVGAAGLFSVNDSNVLYAKNLHEKLYPASLTKVMTALVALKYGNLEAVITVGDEINISISGAQMCGLKQGDTLTLDQALHVFLVYSANDAGNVIAKHIGGSLEGFADMMNQEAKAIGATNSNFVNAHGLPDDNHYVTAYDMYLMFQEALKYEYFKEMIHMTNYTTIYHNKEGAEVQMNFNTTNLYLKDVYQPPEKVTVMGGKTGTTDEAGHCLILYIKDSAGASYISVILRSPNRDFLYEKMSELLNEI